MNNRSRSVKSAFEIHDRNFLILKLNISKNVSRLFYTDWNSSSNFSSFFSQFWFYINFYEYHVQLLSILLTLLIFLNLNSMDQLLEICQRVGTPQFLRSFKSSVDRLHYINESHSCSNCNMISPQNIIYHIVALPKRLR